MKKNQLNFPYNGKKFLTQKEATEIESKINAMAPVENIWIHSRCEGYWTEKPNWDAGENCQWIGPYTAYPITRIENYDGGVWVGWPKPFDQQVKQLLDIAQPIG